VTDPTLRFVWDDLPAVSSDLPGTGGSIRNSVEDFAVVELPSYLPDGKGSHLYLRVRKRGLTTRDLVLALTAAGPKESEIGVAGLKDKWAVTEQWLSIPHRHAAAVEALVDLEGVEILERSRHKNKLGIGHLQGNSFNVRIRGTVDGAAERAAAVADRLLAIGAPNYFGPQRFGRFGTNALDGLRLVQGERVPGGHRLQRFFVAALQSRLFNALLAERILRGRYREVLLGDWAKKHDTGGMFRIEEEEVLADALARAQQLALSATLPLYGRKVRPSSGEAGALEAEVFGRFGLNWIDFSRRRGDRRPSRVRLDALEVVPEGDGLTLRFALPKGSYATSVLREVMKVGVDAPLEPQRSDVRTPEPETPAP
jgi:tRNA pseudouridine13 synthase